MIYLAFDGGLWGWIFGWMSKDGIGRPLQLCW